MIDLIKFHECLENFIHVKINLIIKQNMMMFGIMVDTVQIFTVLTKFYSKIPSFYVKAVG